MSEDKQIMEDFMQSCDAGNGAHPPYYNENVYDTASQMASHVLGESYGSTPRMKSLI
jgi:hypothetical protein